MVSIKICVLFISNYGIMVDDNLKQSTWRLMAVAMTVVPSSKSEEMVDLLHGPAGALLVVAGWTLGGDVVDKQLRCTYTLSNTLRWCRVLCIAKFLYGALNGLDPCTYPGEVRRRSPPHWTSHSNVNLDYSVNTGFNGINFCDLHLALCRCYRCSYNGLYQ